MNVCCARAFDKLDQFTLARRRFDDLDRESDAEGLYGENRGVAAPSCMGHFAKATLRMSLGLYRRGITFRRIRSRDLLPVAPRRVGL
jgi:hypothetical protein